MIPIKYFWSDKEPTDEEIYTALTMANNEYCIVIIKWSMFGCEYTMNVKRGMSFEQCKKQIPTIYGV